MLGNPGISLNALSLAEMGHCRKPESARALVQIMAGDRAMVLIKKL